MSENDEVYENPLQHRLNPKLPPRGICGQRFNTHNSLARPHFFLSRTAGVYDQPGDGRVANPASEHVFARRPGNGFWQCNGRVFIGHHGTHTPNSSPSRASQPHNLSRFPSSQWLREGDQGEGVRGVDTRVAAAGDVGFYAFAIVAAHAVAVEVRGRGGSGVTGLPRHDPDEPNKPRPCEHSNPGAKPVNLV